MGIALHGQAFLDRLPPAQREAFTTLSQEKREWQGCQPFESGR